MAGERPCQVCQHGSRLTIDQAILNGKALRAIARDFGIGAHPGTEQFRPDHKKVERHRDRCMGEAYQAAKAADLEASGLALINRLKELDEAVDEVLARSRKGEPIYDTEGIQVLLEEDGVTPRKRYNERMILAAVQQARKNTEIRARLSGAVPEGDPEALERQRLLLQSPEARRLMAELDALANASDQELPT
jgi:hypothetical protein